MNKINLVMVLDTLDSDYLSGLIKRFDKERFAFLFVINRDELKPEKLVEELIKWLGEDFNIVEYAHKANGEAESVYLGVKQLNQESPIIICSHRRITKDFHSSNFADFCEITAPDVAIGKNDEIFWWKQASNFQDLFQEVKEEFEPPIGSVASQSIKRGYSVEFFKK